MKQDGHGTYQESTVTIYFRIRPAWLVERCHLHPVGLRRSLYLPLANGSSCYGLTNEEYSASFSSDDPLSETAEEIEETAHPSAIAKNATLRYVVVFTPCKPGDVRGVWQYPHFFAGGYQAEIVLNRTNDPFQATKWIGSLTKEGLYYLNMI